MEHFETYADLMNIYENFCGNTMNIDIIDKTYKKVQNNEWHGLGFQPNREHRMSIEKMY